jgi:predicted RNase H-like nuclease
MANNPGGWESRLLSLSKVAGVDGTPGGWAIVIMEAGRSVIQRVCALSNFLGSATRFDLIAVDVPIGLLDAYEVGGRACDRAARKLLGRPRGSSVFPAPVRPVLGSTTWDDACIRSRTSAPDGKALTKQTFAILPKIEEIDELLQARAELREVVREVHPEVCFAELVGKPMTYPKATVLGRKERQHALIRSFPDLDVIERAGRDQGLPIEDILDATVACWSALRLAGGKGRSLPENVPFDSTGLPMAIWI